ncbi:MAG: right-handed parallel beta-helix repeat-containing protein [Candidatus Latescibacterota bacterium]
MSYYPDLRVLRHSRIFGLTRFVLFLFITLFLTQATAALAAIYYVDATGGNDSNNGTSTGTPWRTVAKVNGRTYSPGDQILFMRGRTWNETLVVSSSGASGRHIIYGAYGTGNRPVFNGGNTRAHCVEANNKDYITFSNLDAFDGRTNGFYVHDGDPHDYLVEDCIARSAGDLGFLFKGTHNIIFRRCEATTSYWNGFACQAYTATYACGPYLFEDCDSYNNGHTGYDFQTPQQSHDGITMRRCIGRGNTDQGVFFDQDGGTWRIRNVNLEYCAFYNNGRIGIYFEDTDRRAPYAENITISNCLMYGNGQTGTVVAEGLRGYMQNARIRNCIIANNQVRYSGSKIEMYVNDGGGASNSCDYTLVYSPSTATSISWDGANRTMASFQSSGQNTRGLGVNPLFVNPGASNFALQAGSPCINAGTTVGLTVDLAGKAVPSGSAPDLGVYEYGSGTPNPAVPAIQSVTISPNSGYAKVGAQITITVTAANGQTGLTASNAAINGKSIPLRDSGSGKYTGVYTVAEGDNDGRNVEASGITLTGTGGTSAPATSSGSTLAIDAHTPRIASVVISPNSGTIATGNTVTITVTAANAETGLTASNAAINGRSVPLTGKGSGIYSGVYTVQAGDSTGANIEARDITLKDAAGNTSAPAASSGSTLAVLRSLHFQPQFRNTGSNAMIIVQGAIPPTVNGVPVAAGDEIGVFTPNGMCAGAGVWSGQNLSITVWGDDPEESGVQGFREGERFQFRIWDASAQSELPAAGIFSAGDGMYHDNGVSTLGNLATGGTVRKTVKIPLAAGWNQVSANIIPENAAFATVLGSAAKSVSFVKNGSGQVFWPAYEINQIGEWQVSEGYQIKAEQPDTLVVTGVEVTPAEIRYSLAQGWNLVSFTGIDGMNSAQAFASLGTALKLVKDGSGNVYYPQYGINQIGTLRIGMGYWVCTQSPAVLNYSGVAKMAGFPGSEPLSPVPGSVINTGNSATLLVREAIQPTVQGNALEAGDEIRVYSPEGLLVGKGVWDGTNCALAVQGDDSQTPETDGVRAGEKLTIRIWAGKSNREFETTTSYETGGEGYQTNAFIILSELTGKETTVSVGKTANEKPQSFTLGQNFPNPFNPETTITFELPAASKVTLRIHNALGQKVRTLTEGMFQPGIHRMVWDGKNDSGAQVTSGVYFYTIQAGSFAQTRKMTLTR